MLEVAGKLAERMVILVRHGEAMSEQQDPRRPLTQRGQDQARAAGRWLARHRFPAQRILHSTKLRARQTAEIIAAELQQSLPLEECHALGPTDDVRPMADRLGQEQYGSLIVVGHLPFLARLVGHLTVGDASREFAGFEECALALLCDMNGQWTIWCLMQPKWAD